VKEKYALVMLWSQTFSFNIETCKTKEFQGQPINEHPHKDILYLSLC